MFLINSYLDIMPIVSYALTIIGYMPEIYTLSYVLVYKKSTRPYVGSSIWFIWIGAAMTYGVYAYIIGQYVFVISNAITAALCLIVFCLRLAQPRELLPITNPNINTPIGMSAVPNSDFIEAV